jgi:hypothetical protein
LDAHAARVDSRNDLELPTQLHELRNSCLT